MSSCVALIGYGRWGSTLFSNLAFFSDYIEHLYVVSRHAEKYLAATNNSVVQTSLVASIDLLPHEKIDAVVIECDKLSPAYDDQSDH